MTPDQLAKSDTEHAHQRAFFAWLAYAAYSGFDCAHEWVCGVTSLSVSTSAFPELTLMHAIPNGGHRSKSEAAKLKAEGVKAGVLDTFLPVSMPFTYPARMENGNEYRAASRYNGLYIEFKAPAYKNRKNGGMSANQDAFCDAVREQGYCARVAYSWREAANHVMAYYGVSTRL